MPKVDLGPFTDEDMAALLKDVLNNMPESEVLPILRDWLKDNDLEGELDAAPQTPYPWCHGSPTKADCAARGYCNRDPNCGE